MAMYRIIFSRHSDGELLMANIPGKNEWEAKENFRKEYPFKLYDWSSMEEVNEDGSFISDLQFEFAIKFTDKRTNDKGVAIYTAHDRYDAMKAFRHDYSKEKYRIGYISVCP